MDTIRDIHFWRQVFILITGCFTSIAAGILFAHTGVLNKAILAVNATDISTTSDIASWMAASTGFSGLVGFFLLTPIFQFYGRKPVHICMGVITLTSWLLLSYAKNVESIWAGRIIQGISFGGVFIFMMTLAEYVHPRRRGYFLTIKKATISLGSLICQALSLICTWRQIAMVAAGLTILNLIAVPFWPETPAFLAMKGRYEQCTNSYKWLNEKSEENVQELRNLVISQSQILDRSNALNKPGAKNIAKVIISKDFSKPFFIVALISLAIDASGRFFLLSYMTQIIEMISGDHDLAVYCSTAFDGLILLALCLGTVLVSFYSRRALLFWLGLLTVLLMFIISLVIILQRNNIAQNLTWLVPFIIFLQGFIAHIGLIPVGYAISTEVFPLDIKGLGMCASGVVYTSLYAFTMKLTPIMLYRIGIEGMYAVYGLIVLVCVAILYIIMPETKDKTLQDIENEIRGVQRSDVSTKLMPLEPKE